MSKMPVDSKPELIINPQLPTIFADKMQCVMRSDGLTVLRWLQDIDSKTCAENARIMVTHDHLRKIIDALCQGSGYYPKQEKK